jgi:hypothetical protein
VNEEELRALVRAAIQRHLSAPSASAREPLSELRRDAAGANESISFAQYQIARAPDDTMCLIEPAVRCNHCGFCKCHGH